MRIRALLVAVTATASLAVSAAACTSNSGTTPAPKATTTAASDKGNVSGDLPAWSPKAPGSFANMYSMPADAKVIWTQTGSNPTADAPTNYTNLTSIGDGMQVRYTCNDVQIQDGDYFHVQAGILDNAGQPKFYDRTGDPGGRSGSFFYSWKWLPVNFEKGRPFIAPWGNCKWEIHLLTWTSEPTPVMPTS